VGDQESSDKVGSQFKSPLSPLIITSRASAAVSATSAIRHPGYLCASSRTHSEPIRVLPKPRPARTTQVFHIPGGAFWLGRAQKSQFHRSSAFSLSDKEESISSRSSGGSDARISAGDRLAIINSPQFGVCLGGERQKLTIEFVSTFLSLLLHLDGFTIRTRKFLTILKHC